MDASLLIYSNFKQNDEVQGQKMEISQKGLKVKRHAMKGQFTPWWSTPMLVKQIKS